MSKREAPWHATLNVTLQCVGQHLQFCEFNSECASVGKFGTRNMHAILEFISNAPLYGKASNF